MKAVEKVLFWTATSAMSLFGLCMAADAQSGVRVGVGISVPIRVHPQPALDPFAVGFVVVLAVIVGVLYVADKVRGGIREESAGGSNEGPKWNLVVMFFLLYGALGIPLLGYIFGCVGLKEPAKKRQGALLIATATVSSLAWVSAIIASLNRL